MMKSAIRGGIAYDNIKWVFFDYDGTLRHNEPNGLNTFHQFVEGQGVPLDAPARRRAHRWNHRYWASSEMLKQDAREAGEELDELYKRYTRRYLEQLGIEGEQLDELTPVLQQRMADEYNPVDHVPPEVQPTLERLGRKGYLLALISNRRHPLAESVAELGLSNYFEFTLAAGEVGAWKPDPELLRLAAERAGIAPQHAVYVGDNPYADVAGAQAASLHPILIDPDGIFPEVDCPVIKRLDQLLPLLSP